MRGRRSSPAWRVGKKVLLLAAVLLCLRLAWVAMVRGWSSGTLVDVEIQEQHVDHVHRKSQREKHNDNVRIDSEIQHLDKVYSKTVEGFTKNRVASDNEDQKLRFKPTTSKSRTSQPPSQSGKGKEKGKPPLTTTSVKPNIKTTVTLPEKVEKNEVLEGRFYDNNKLASQQKADLKSQDGKKPAKAAQGGAVSDGVCQATVPWGQKYQAQISTYDLVKQANYTTDENGAYYIPIRKTADIIKDPELPEVTVILVPFSHADPGYGMTFDGYYNQRTRNTLMLMLDKLTHYPNMTFQWAETVFLARWFDDLTAAQKTAVRRLVGRGQLEVVLGGWVMPDEASTHYGSVVDQLIEGHQWLAENLGVKPRTAWVNDPFGYSSTMPYLWKSSGMDNMVFLRIDQPLKAQLMKRKSLEFNWRPYWKRDNSSDMLATLMSYTNYWIADVCGPDPAICNEFGFINSGYNQQVVEITDENVEKQSMKLYGQLRMTADLYKYNNLYIGLGEDFSFGRETDWDSLYRNYDKIIKFFNSRKDLKMKIKFGTLAEYFTNVRREAKRKAEAVKSKPDAEEFPTLSGDFYPYTERKHEYWTGYFTTRPLNKRFSRDIGSLLRAADIFNVLTFSMFKHYGVQYTGYKDVSHNLRVARRELGMFLHHDGITGTSLPSVIDDFEIRLLRAFTAVNEAFRSVLSALLTKGQHQTAQLIHNESSKRDAKSITRHNTIDISSDGAVVLVNSLSRKRREVISVFVNTKNFEIERPDKSRVPVQISELDNYIRVSFLVELPAFGVEVYKFKQRDGVNLDNEAKEEMMNSASLPSPQSPKENIVIKNDYLTVECDPVTGMMTKVTDRSGKVTKMAAKFYAYKVSSSGAYIFGPAGPAEPLKTGNPTIKVLHGRLMSEVKVVYPGIVHTVRLYNTLGLQGHGIHVTNELDMAAINLKETEVILRFDTDLKNGHNFYTDQNGYQLMGRETKPKMPIEANYYPISNMAVLEDREKRVSLHSRQSHGVASLEEGQLEVMLDRHTMRDDGRGLGQGYYQNVNVNSDFVIHIEHKTAHRDIAEPRYTYPTQDSTILNDLLQNEIFVYELTDISKASLSKLHPLKSTQIPCDVSVVGLRNLVTNDLFYNGTSLVLHRKSFECGYQSVSKHCVGKDKLTVRSLLPKLNVSIVETSLSHLENITALNMDSDITPDHMELRAFRIQV